MWLPPTSSCLCRDPTGASAGAPMRGTWSSSGTPLALPCSADEDTGAGATGVVGVAPSGLVVSEGERKLKQEAKKATPV